MRKTLICLAGLTTLAGCTPNDTTLGGALRHDLAIQTIDPDPQYEGKDSGVSGTHSASAVERYRKGAVKEPVSISTQQTRGSSSGGSSSSSGR